VASSMAESKTDKDSFIRDENGVILPIIENFYRFCGQRKLMGVKCSKCHAVMWPPRAICGKCFGYNFEWVEFQGKGELITYTIIYFPPTQFQALAPYAVGIVKLTEGPQLPGMIRYVKLEDLRIGLKLQVDFESTIPKDWPRWPRYFFKALN